MATHTQQQPQVNAERPDIGSSLTRDPKHSQIPLLIKLEQLGFVHGTNAELALHSRDQRRTLEEGTGQGLERSGECAGVWKGVVESKDGNVFFACALLRFDETRCPIDADD
jgi:hypothetical protein